MWIQVRSFDGKKSIQVDNLSKLTKIEELRERLVEPFDAPQERQRLFYRGKQMEDGHTLFDYSVGLNDLIQLMVRAPPPTPTVTPAQTESSDTKLTNGYASSGEESASSDKENQRPLTPEKDAKPSTSSTVSGVDTDDSIYKIGDIIDARDLTIGAWFEAKIIKISRVSDEDNAEGLENTEDKKSEINETSDKPDEKRSTSEEKKALVDITEKKDENSNEQDSCIDSMEIDDKSEQDKSNCDTISSDVSKTDLKSTVSENKDSLSALFEKKHILTDHDVVKEDGFIYHIIYEGYEEECAKMRCKNIRPRARTNLNFSDLKEGQKVMSNYNVDDPDQRGFWYDCVITSRRDTRSIKELYATVFIGSELTPLSDCKLLFITEVFDIEKPGTQINEADIIDNPEASPVKRTNKPECDHCLDNPRRKCKHCACCVCGGKNDPESQILCDECNQAYHLNCLSPKLDKVPEEDEWYCPNCKTDDNEIVKAGEKLKESKKKSKMASAQGNTSRDWGRGMACVGRQKVCNVVPPNHFGPIPGVEVGTMWKFRVGVSEAGVHRPHVAGIHGREDEGSYSIVLSGGYEDDHDDGDEFTYTGSGGRDLSGNKRTAEQSCDQTLTRMNKALAKNCNAPLDSKKGAEAVDWQGGKPVRVVRNCKGRKHSKYAPEEGNRYDGIYKMVKYWPSKGKSGFLVWRYMLRRDDPTPAPWTSKGKKKIKELGLEMQYPDGYLEAQALKEKEKESGETPGKGKGKRKRQDSDSSPSGTPEKKAKVAEYKIDKDQKELIEKDTDNKKVWDEALEFKKEGAQKFLQKVEELFTCICCQEIVFKPVTTECSHNICKSCLQRAFKAEVYNCPTCRTDLGKDYSMPINKTLGTILKKFYPGYEAGR